MVADIFDQQYWLAIRRGAHLRDDMLGHGLCHIWAESALEQLLETGVKGFSKAIFTGPANRPDGTPFTFVHSLLVSFLPNGEWFVADGTAGQILGSPPQGYHGLAKDAPACL